MSLGTPTYESEQEQRKAHIKWAFSVTGFFFAWGIVLIGWFLMWF